MSSALGKRGAADLAAFGGPVLFERPRSTSNLVRPSFDAFLDYSRRFFAEHRYSNAGPLSKLLERRLAEFHEVDHCISFASGFWGLVLAKASMKKDGMDEVVMPSLTYRRLADAAAWAGLTPHFCEVDPGTLAPCAATVAAEINERTALILATQPIVNCCDAPGIEALGYELGLPVLFDSVESVYESVAGRRVGGFGNAELFSLHASKLLNGFEGGYVTTNDPELTDSLELARGFGFRGQDNAVLLGLNAKLNEIHAAMALAALDDLDDQVRRNRERYETYRSLLSGLGGVRLLEFDETERCSFKNIVVELTEEWPLDRDTTVRILNEDGVLARAYYSPPLHAKTTSYDTVAGDMSTTERLARRFVLLPCGHHVSLTDIAAVVELLEFLQRSAAEIVALSRRSVG